MGGAEAEMKKGPWTREEDQKLLAYIDRHGYGSWRTLPTKAGLQRCGKSCRLRWTNYLRPDIKRGKFSSQEEKTIIRLHALLGNRWSAIAAHLPKRTDNEIKNYWNTRLKKRLTRMGIDPATHKPKNNPAGSAQSAALSHMAQWEAARLEAEARLARESKHLHRLPLLRKLASSSPPPRPPPRPPPPPPPCLDVLRVWESTAIPRCFFSSCSSSSSLESPTASSIVANDVVSINDGGGGGFGDMFHHGGGLTGTMDFAAFDQDLYGGGVGGFIVGEMEEDGKNYWDYLLNTVSSPAMESPEL